MSNLFNNKAISFNTKISEVVQAFIDKLDNQEAELKELDRQMNLALGIQDSLDVARIESQIDHVRTLHWRDEVIRPIAEALNEMMPDYSLDVSGPFGISARVSLEFTHRDNPELFRKMDIDPWMLFERQKPTEERRLAVIDYSKSTHEYKPDTVGYINGLNHPRIEIDPESRISDLMSHLSVPEMEEIDIASPGMR